MHLPFHQSFQNNFFEVGIISWLTVTKKTEALREVKYNDTQLEIVGGIWANPFIYSTDINWATTMCQVYLTLKLMLTTLLIFSTKINSSIVCL